MAHCLLNIYNYYDLKMCGFVSDTKKIGDLHSSCSYKESKMQYSLNFVGIVYNLQTKSYGFHKLCIYSLSIFFSVFIL